MIMSSQFISKIRVKSNILNAKYSGTIDVLTQMKRREWTSVFELVLVSCIVQLLLLLEKLAPSLLLLRQGSRLENAVNDIRKPSTGWTCQKGNGWQPRLTIKVASAWLCTWSVYIMLFLKKFRSFIINFPEFRQINCNIGKTYQHKTHFKDK